MKTKIRLDIAISVTIRPQTISTNEFKQEFLLNRIPAAALLSEYQIFLMSQTYREQGARGNTECRSHAAKQTG